MVKELPYSAVEPLDENRRRLLADALKQVLPPAQLKAALELSRAASHDGTEPQPEEIMYWLRLNMPVAAARVEEILHPND
jgi:hypothetical protein